MIFFCVVNLIFVLLIILLNGLVVVIIWKILLLYSVLFNFFFLCFVCVDFMNGLISELFVVVYMIGEVIWDVGLFCVLGFIMEFVVWFVSVILGIIVFVFSVDRFIVVYMYLRYNEIVIVCRMMIFIVVMWFLFIVNIFVCFLGVINC